MSNIRYLVFAWVLALLTGCGAVQKMPWAEGGAKPDANQTVYLMSVELRNDHKPRWQPEIWSFATQKGDGSAKEDRQIYSMDPKGEVSPSPSGGSRKYLLRIPADGKATTLVAATGSMVAFPIRGYFHMPLHASLPTAGPGVHYLGTAKAILRERVGNEFRAGGVLPLLDQAISGASTGTFDIEFADAFEADMALFKAAFPQLQELPVSKALLAPWDRAKAQQAWEQQ